LGWVSAHPNPIFVGELSDEQHPLLPFGVLSDPNRV
jgi:hypothetical protein